ncbi:hypothetical protein [Caulobacter henricii]|uniref:Uncharacterized protein n=1 Tax=Caulobacter henricii TaxID=69395 RepID=A0A0P0P1R6_9CAUL|nr:hypothetical protein [Caulobacter henricii]ALL14255.1 hypothetical protein AQ619_13395 [Caulobacter henricii]
MALGKVASRNLLPLLSLGGTAGSAALPLSNLMTNALAVSPRHLTQPMRQTDIATLSANVIELTFDRPRAIDLVGILFHSLSLTAKYRITVAGVGGSLAAPVFQSAWTKVHPRRYASLSLRWEETNWWGGQALLSDLDVFRRHRFVPVVPALVASALRIEFDDRLNPAGFYDIGGLWVSSAWSPAFNFERGRTLGLQARDRVEEGPSGRRFSERRQPRRTMSVTWAATTKAEIYRLFDDCARVGTTGMVIFIPDVDDVTGSAREAFPANFAKLIEPQFTYEHQHTVSAALEEIIA